ncbi:response regulator [Pseudomonas sp. PB120]|uniref:response regulator n=1 Tax=Pseudomonas sp. PB120 TaxID=2494700 RepID=UPI0012FD53D6|nr:response regulator [Pseudomonas sp. PB120]MVV47480.1 response regulator [Pseudomonas sp. PB120]
MKAKWEKLLPLTGWVVVVEDEPALRMLTVEILTEVGLRPLDFQSADDALTYLLGMPDGCPLVVVDQSLPGKLKGTEFIELVKSKWPLTAAILTSGYELDPSAVPASTIYLQKPWSMDDLVMAVATLLHPDHPALKLGNH